MFIRNAWYVAAWADEINQAPLGRRRPPPGDPDHRGRAGGGGRRGRGVRGEPR